MSKQDKTDQSDIKARALLDELEIGGAIYSTRLTSKFKDRPMWTPADHRKILAVIPGTIQKLMVSVGDEVATGDSMLILEAMKMRNEIKAMQPGVIKAINISEGEHVSKSHLLLEFE